MTPDAKPGPTDTATAVHDDRTGRKPGGVDLPPEPTSVGRDTDGRITTVSWRLFTAPRLPAAGRWLLAFDGSPHAVRAARQLAGMLKDGFDAGASIVYIHPWLAKEAAELMLARKGWEQSAAARDVFDALALPFDVHVALGNAAEKLLAVAQRERCAGIVIGSHGWTSLEALVLGSVTQHVLANSRVPVLVTR
jgi:nucleotide-binding universal stress UspA family protein